MYFRCARQDLPGRPVPGLQVPPPAHARRRGGAVEPIHRAVRALGWPVLAIEGVEADDIIGTLACRAAEQGVDTIVSTGDKDLAQLVNSR